MVIYLPRIARISSTASQIFDLGFPPTSNVFLSWFSSKNSLILGRE